MTDKQKMFVEAYVGEAKFCATKAAKMAGYSPRTAYAKGHDLKKQLAPEIDVRLSDLSMSASEVLSRLGEIARNEGSNYIRPRNGSSYLDVPAIIRANKGHLIKGIKKTTHGLEVTLMDPQPALELLAKYHKLITEQHKVEVHDEGIAAALNRKLAGLALALEASGVPVPADGEGAD